MRRPWLAVVPGLALSTLAMAQSSVTLYGSIDLGAVRISNLGGSRTLRLDPGTTQPDRVGFRGSEDLGDGLKAHVHLEAGFATDIGSSNSPTAFFNRLSVVGLSGAFGTVQLGHQPDLMFDWVAKTSNGFQLNNFYAFHPGNFDTLFASFIFDNAIRYNTPTWNGLTLGVVAGAGEGAGRNLSAGANYLDGPLRVAAAYSVEDKRTLRGFAAFAGSAGLPPGGAMDKVKNAGAGAAYRFRTFSVNAVYTQTVMEVGSQRARMRNIDLGGSWFVTPVNAINLGLSRSTLGHARWNTVSLVNLYHLSKRTQIYAQGTLQQASNQQVAVLALGASSTPRQNIVSAGIHHSF